ncbi:hypothetical protein QCA50_020506 [Cerrena zonata]|uniref:Thiaminase-2/PQQC domain-containing protein n=1 Tax=Cerrena zonata TaxID=2478898 RepID=A0AAW0FAB3_9APHY
MSSFVDQLLAKHHSVYTESITHPLTNELCQGTLPDYKLFTYLTQDLKFFQVGLNLFGKTLALCDDAKAAITLENLVELKLKVPRMLQEDSITLPQVQSYIDLLNYLVFECNSYVEVITFMYVMEEVYLGWANYHLEKGTIPKDLAYKYHEWIILHSGEAFTGWVQFLKNEVNRVVTTEDAKKKSEQIFLQTLTLEIDFFGACYDYSEDSQ